MICKSSLHRASYPNCPILAKSAGQSCTCGGSDCRAPSIWSRGYNGHIRRERTVRVLVIQGMVMEAEHWKLLTRPKWQQITMLTVHTTQVFTDCSNDNLLFAVES